MKTYTEQQVRDAFYDTFLARGTLHFPCTIFNDVSEDTAHEAVEEEFREFLFNLYQVADK